MAVHAVSSLSEPPALLCLPLTAPLLPAQQIISLLHRLSNGGGGGGGGEAGGERQELRRREHRRHAPAAAAQEADDGPPSAPVAHPGEAAALSRLRTQASWGREQREGSPLGPDTPSDHAALPPHPSHAGARGGAAKPRRHTPEIHADGAGRHWGAA